MSRALATPAQLVPESNHTSIVSVPFRYLDASPLSPSGSRSSTSLVNHASLPSAMKTSCTCAMVSSVSSGSPDSLS